MNINDAFPSRFIKAAQIREPHDLTIRCVTMEEVGDDRKPVLYFEGRTAGLVMNKTQGFAVAEIHGEDMEKWSGGMIRIGPGTTHYGGKMVGTVVVSTVPEIAKDPPAPGHMGGGADDIPF